MQGGFGMAFFSKDWVRRTSTLHEAVRRRINTALDAVDGKSKDTGGYVREADPRKAASRIIEDFEEQLNMISDNSMQEKQQLKQQPVIEYVRKIEQFCKKIKRAQNG